jgi:hypothetical protein
MSRYPVKADARPSPGRHCAAPRRRGVLLLVVLSMLTLFLMLGAAYIVAATRARETARAFSRLMFGGDDVRVPHSRLLDAVLLKVVAGDASALRATGYPAGLLQFESILADKYGSYTLSGTASSVAVNGQVVTAQVSLPLCRPSDLLGRVLTFVEPGLPATSHRIVRAFGNGASNEEAVSFKLALDVPNRLPAFAAPAVASARVIVNGREYAGSAPDNEGWDGYDFVNNPFLTQVRSSTSSISSSHLLRGSYVSTVNGTFGVIGTAYAFSPLATGTLLTVTTDLTVPNKDLVPDVADNDNDGVPDGLFVDFGLPSTTDAYGNPVQLRASVMIVPLDGRFNMNAHDTIMRTMYTGTVFAAGSGTNPNWTTVISTTSVPLGSGYGPAEVSASHMFVPTGTGAPTGTTTFQIGNGERPLFFTAAGGVEARSVGRRPQGSRYSPLEFTPRLGALEGRYGEAAPRLWTNLSGSNTQLATMRTGTDFARPGLPDLDDPASRLVDQRSTVAGSSNGLPPIWWNRSSTFNWLQPLASELGTSPRGVFNSPPDLHGRMRSVTLSATGGGVVPLMRYAQPEWSTSSADARETKDDPYELRLDTRLGFGGLLADPGTSGTVATLASIARDNPFIPAELDPVLRPYDIDTNRLPPRLAAMLGSAAEESRLKITTDSWDTTAITGSAAAAIFGSSNGTPGWLQREFPQVYGSDAAGVLAGEVSRGERFDLNRALAAAEILNAGYGTTAAYHVQRQAYFRDLYTLAVMLSSSNGVATIQAASGPLTGTAATAVLAQWAANAVEFRDADSRVIPFAYDSNPYDGWTVDNNAGIGGSAADRAVVWGAERPEIVIAETLAWENVDSGTVGGLFVALHRPWNAKAYASGSTNMIDAEPCDIAFDELSAGRTGRPTNVIDLGKKAHDGVLSGTNELYESGSNAVFPIWRLRIVAPSGTAFVRFDTGTSVASGSSGPVYGVNAITNPATSGSAKPKLAVDSTLTLLGGPQIVWATSSTTGTITVSLSGSSCAISGSAGLLRVPGGPVSGTSARKAVVYLERLADPTRTATPAEWDADPFDTSGSNVLTQRYVIVDSSTVTVHLTGTSFQPSPPSSHTLTSLRRPTGSGDTSFWKTGTSAGAAITLPGSVSITFPNLATGANAAAGTVWFPWPNRPFVSAAELLLVPRGDSLGMLANYERISPANQGRVGSPVPLSLLLDAVHVPSRFAGIHTTATNTRPADTGIDTTVTTVNQFSSFREPGRVNLNVTPSEDVWNAVVAGPLNAPVVTGTRARLSLTDSAAWNPAPAKSMLDVLALSENGATIVSDSTTTVSGSTVAMPSNVLAWDKNPLHEIYTATRLANTATPRSNVFAIWITLQESVPNDPDSVTCHRAFYIVDRSIPVGFESGKTYNVWDCVRLRRIIE